MSVVYQYMYIFYIEGEYEIRVKLTITYTILRTQSPTPTDLTTISIGYLPARRGTIGNLTVSASFGFTLTEMVLVLDEHISSEEFM